MNIMWQLVSTVSEAILHLCIYVVSMTGWQGQLHYDPLEIR